VMTGRDEDEVTGIEVTEGTEKVVTDEEVKERRVVLLENLLLHSTVVDLVVDVAVLLPHHKQILLQESFPSLPNITTPKPQTNTKSSSVEPTKLQGQRKKIG